MKKLFIFSIFLAMIIYNICQETGTKSACQQKVKEGETELKASDCTSLATSDKNKYTCALKSDKSGCEEVKKATESESSSASSMIKISLFLLISLLII